MNLPPELDTEAFRTAWAEWLAYRKERHLGTYKPIGLRRQLNALAVHGPESAIEAIELSMRQNYQGLFPKPARFQRRGGLGEFSGAF